MSKGLAFWKLAAAGAIFVILYLVRGKRQD